MDWLGNATAERLMTQPLPSRWQYPSLWHSVYITVPMGTLEIFMVDTVTLTGAMLDNPGQAFIPDGGSTGAPPVPGVPPRPTAPAVYWPPHPPPPRPPPPLPPQMSPPPAPVITATEQATEAAAAAEAAEAAPSLLGLAWGGYATPASSPPPPAVVAAAVATPAADSALAEDDALLAAVLRASPPPAVVAKALPVVVASPPPAVVAASPPPPVANAAAAALASETFLTPTEAAEFAPAGRRRQRQRRHARRQLLDFNEQGPPPVSELQWGWLALNLNASTADWVIVVGNDPVWSAGDHGPTWGLVRRLLPYMDAAGVALYISGRDPVAQHFAPSAAYPAVDFAVTGNGAGGNASQASQLPMSNQCPADTLAWSSSGADGGFMTVEIAPSAAVAGTTAMTVTFYDETGVSLYSFSKANPRKMVATAPAPAPSSDDAGAYEAPRKAAAAGAKAARSAAALSPAKTPDRAGEVGHIVRILFLLTLAGVLAAAYCSTGGDLETHLFPYMPILDDGSGVPPPPPGAAGGRGGLPRRGASGGRGSGVEMGGGGSGGRSRAERGSRDEYRGGGGEGEEYRGDLREPPPAQRQAGGERRREERRESPPQQQYGGAEDRYSPPAPPGGRQRVTPPAMGMPRGGTVGGAARRPRGFGAPPSLAASSGDSRGERQPLLRPSSNRNAVD